jgi:hypothetical protein
MSSPEEGARQIEIDFTAAGAGNGYTRWQEQRQAALRQLALQMGLPLGRNVVVRLRDGVELSGLLRLKEEKLFIEETRDFSLELIVDGVEFTAAEIEACVRTD